MLVKAVLCKVFSDCLWLQGLDPMAGWCWEVMLSGVAHASCLSPLPSAKKQVVKADAYLRSVKWQHPPSHSFQFE